MSYRMIVSAGVAVGMTAATALAQIQQPTPTFRVNGEELKELLNDLEGSWNVEVEMWSMAEAQRHTRPGVQPGEPSVGDADTRRIEQQIQQAMTQAGVSQQEAQQHAQRLARQFVQQRPPQTQIERELQTAMTQAGVEMQEAQQQAQRLSQQISQQLRDTPRRPGLRPEDDDTASPMPGDRDRDRWATPDLGPATLRAEGRSNRDWALDDNILEEEVDFSMTTEAPADNNNQRFNNQRLDRNRDRALELLRDGETLEGHGMFGFDEESGHLYHVWADSSDSKIYFSVGEYDAQQRTVTFHTADAREIVNGIRPTEPRREPGLRPGEPRPGQPGTRPGTRPGTPGDEPGASLAQYQDRPGQARPGIRPGQEDRPRVVLRIIDDNEHVVEYFKATNPGNAVRTMKITYTRNN